MIVGSLHLYRTARAGLIGQGRQEKVEDVTRFDYADADPLEVVRMLESVLTTVKQQIEAQEKAKQDAKTSATASGEKPLTGRQRRSHLIEDEDED